jgi:hypothetical protein
LNLNILYKTILKLESYLNKVVKIFPLLLFLSSVFICNYILISDRSYLERSFQSVQTSIQNEKITQMTEEGLNYISNNVGIRLLYALQQTVKSICSISLLAFLLWLTLSFITDNWISFINVFYSMSLATIVLTLGILIDTSIKLSCFNFISYFEFGILVNYFELHPLLKTLSSGYNIFTTLFLLIFSVFTSRFYKEKLLTLFLVSNMCWLLVLILLFLLGISVSLSA